MEQPEIDPALLEEILAEFGQEPQAVNGGNQVIPPQGAWHAIEEEAQAQEEPGNNFRLSARKVALTFSRCGIGRPQIGDFFTKSWSRKEKTDWVLVAEEKHHKGVELVEEEDDQPETHYHVFLWFKGKLETRNPKIFDIPGPGGVTYHPNIQTIKGKDGEKRWFEYCIKEDADWIVRGNASKADILKKFKGSGTDRDMYGALLQTGQLTLYEFVQKKPSEMWTFKNLEYGYISFKAMENSKKFTDWKPLTTKKQRHYWIWGPSNSGKTTVMKALVAHRKELWFQIPTNNDWVGYCEQPYLYIDEYSGQLKISELNRLCDGGAKVNIKGSSAIICETPTVFIYSNMSPSKCYEEAFDKDPVLKATILNRFIEVETRENPNWPDLIQDVYPVMPVLPHGDPAEQ